MKKSFVFLVLSVATVAALSMAVFAQQTPTPQVTAATNAGQLDLQSVTIIGCVQRESDYRRARDAGKGGVAGTGIGAGNEFVLVNASITPAPDTPAGTAGTSAAIGHAYELTGKNEGLVANHINKRVEITGKLKPAEMGAAGPTGGATAGTPPAGIDVTSKDLKLREVEVISVKETTGTCPSK